MNWLEHLSQAIAYLEDNLAGTISYEEAAKIACCSVGYFQRTFSYLTGITVSTYIRRRRMTLAGYELKGTDQKIIEIAYKYDYSSPTAFNRAFTSVHGMSPSQARKSQSQLHSYAPLSFSIQLQGGENMSYRIIEKPAMNLVGISVPLSYDREADMAIVPEFWQKTIENPLFEQLSDLATEPVVYGITDTSADQHCYYIAVEATDCPKDLIKIMIPPAKRVIFEAEGPLKESVQTMFKRFLLEWLPFSHYDYGGGPDIEVYPLEPKHNEHSEIWIAIKEKKHDL